MGYWRISSGGQRAGKRTAGATAQRPNGDATAPDERGHSLPVFSSASLRLCALAFLALTLTITLSPTPRAQAADFTVNTCNETTLRSVITSAQTNNGNRVVFACNGTILLTGGFTNAISVTKTLTIDGTGHTVTIDGGGNVPLFVMNNATTTFTATALTLTRGSASGGGFGGAIANNGGGTVNVVNSTLSSNTTDRNGGAIYTSGGIVNVTNSTLTINVANGNFGLGGAIANFGGVVNVTSSTLSGNTTTNFGGSIYTIGGTVNVTNSTLSGGTADSSGGGIYSYSGAVNVTNSTFSGNTANSFSTAEGGGGIYNKDTGSTVNVMNSTLSGNTATHQDGGAIFTFGTVNVINSTLSGNTANGSVGGGGILNGGTVNATNTLIVNNVDGDVSSNPLTTNSHNLTGNFTFTGTLTNHGGPTQTLAIPTPTIQGATDAYTRGDLATCQTLKYAGTTTPLPFDQRGASRVVNGKCSIGAFEPGNPSTVTNLTSAPRSVGPGANLTLTATVRGALDGTPVTSGIVTFTNNGVTPLGTGTVTSGMATFTTTLPLGTNSVTATYGGGTNLAASPASAPVTVTVAVPLAQPAPGNHPPVPTSGVPAMRPNPTKHPTSGPAGGVIGPQPVRH